MEDRKIECYPKQMIKNIFRNLDETTKLRKEIFIETMRPFIPYCLIEIKDGIFLPCNRDYKPLGMPSGFYYEYEKYEFLFIKKEDLNLKPLWDNGISFGQQGYFFYSDYCPPSPKNLYRYLEILKIVFFGKKMICSFDYYWGFKFGLDKEGWERNRKKINEH